MILLNLVIPLIWVNLIDKVDLVNMMEMLNIVNLTICVILVNLVILVRVAWPAAACREQKEDKMTDTNSCQFQNVAHNFWVLFML